MTPFNTKNYSKKSFSKFTKSKFLNKNLNSVPSNAKKHQNLTINLTLDEPRLVILSSKNINKPTKFFNNLAWKHIAKNSQNYRKNEFKLNNVKLTNAPANTTQYLIKDIETRDASFTTQVTSCLQNTHDFEHDWNLAQMQELQVS